MSTDEHGIQFFRSTVVKLSGEMQRVLEMILTNDFRGAKSALMQMAHSLRGLSSLRDLLEVESESEIEEKFQLACNGLWERRSQLDNLLEKMREEHQDNMAFQRQMDVAITGL